MSRILFLDFDGVLHPNLCAPEEWFTRSPLLEDALAHREVESIKGMAR